MLVKSFIKLTPGYGTAILHSHSLVHRGRERGKKKSARGGGGGGNFYWYIQGEPLWRREAWSPKPCKGLAICRAKAIPSFLTKLFIYSIIFVL